MRSDKRPVCIKERPWSLRLEKELGLEWIHPDASLIEGSQRNIWPSGFLVDLKCPVCELIYAVNQYGQCAAVEHEEFLQ
jgi:hypothetical protein